MEVESPAADLFPRHHHLAAILLEDPDGGLVDGGEERGHNTADEERDLQPPLPLRGKGRPRRGKEEAIGEGGKHGEQLLDRLWEEAIAGEPGRPPGRAKTLAHLEEDGEAVEAGGMRKQLMEDNVPHEALEKGLGPGLCEIRPGLFQEMAESDARRTDGLAGQASEAPVDVGGKTPLRIDPPLGQKAHQGDPASGGVHLLVKLPVRRASGEAHPAENASGKLPGTEDGRWESKRLHSASPQDPLGIEGALDLHQLCRPPLHHLQPLSP